MPSIAAASDNFTSTNTEYQSFTNLCNASPIPFPIVPFPGRQGDGDMLGLTSTYTPSINRNNATAVSTSAYIFTSPNLTSTVGAFAGATAGNYIYTQSSVPSAQVIRVVSGSSTFATVGGTQITNIPAGFTNTLAYGQLVTGAGVPAATYVTSFGSNSAVVSQSITTNGTQQVNFGDYAALTGNPIASSTPLLAVFQTNIQTRGRDAPYANLTTIAADNQTLSVTFASNGSYATCTPSDFYIGDTLLIVSQMGDATAYNNVGNYEFATLLSNTSSTTTSATFVLTNPLVQSYGRVNNTTLTGQTVNVYRVPEYRNVTSTASILAEQFNYTTQGQVNSVGGVLCFMADYINLTGGSANANNCGYSRTSGVTYFGSQATQAANAFLLLMGAAGQENGIYGGGAVCIGVRQTNRLSAQANGQVGLTANAGSTSASGGTAVVVAVSPVNGLPALSAISSTIGGPPGLPGKTKGVIGTSPGMLLPANGAGNYSNSTPAGYFQNL